MSMDHFQICVSVFLVIGPDTETAKLKLYAERIVEAEYDSRRHSATRDNVWTIIKNYIEGTLHAGVVTMANGAVGEKELQGFVKAATEKLEEDFGLKTYFAEISRSPQYDKLLPNNAADQRSSIHSHAPTLVDHARSLLSQRTKLHLLNDLIDILQGICYRYTQRNCAHLLLQHGWACQEAVDLNKWVVALEGHHEEFAPQNGRRCKVLRQLVDIHSSVNNPEPRMDCNYLLGLFSTAAEVAEKLQDDGQRRVLENVKADLQAKVDGFHGQIADVENQLQTQIADAARAERQGETVGDENRPGAGRAGQGRTHYLGEGDEMSAVYIGDERDSGRHLFSRVLLG